jgi:hypothetical protein
MLTNNLLVKLSWDLILDVKSISIFNKVLHMFFKLKVVLLRENDSS